MFGGAEGSRDVEYNMSSLGSPAEDIGGRLPAPDKCRDVSNMHYRHQKRGRTNRHYGIEIGSEDRGTWRRRPYDPYKWRILHFYGIMAPRRNGRLLECKQVIYSTYQRRRVPRRLHYLFYSIFVSPVI